MAGWRETEDAAPTAAVVSSTAASTGENRNLYLDHSTIHLALQSTSVPISDAAYKAAFISIPVHSSASTDQAGNALNQTPSAQPQPQASQQTQQPQATSISASETTGEATVMTRPQNSQESDTSNAMPTVPRSLSREAELGIVFGCVGAAILILGAAMFYWYRREPLRKINKLGSMDSTLVAKSSISRPQARTVVGMQVPRMATAVTTSKSPYAEPRRPLPSIPDSKRMSNGRFP